LINFFLVCLAYKIKSVKSIYQTNFKFPNQTNYYKGKVRDVYTLDDNILVMIASDRISAFDVVLPKAIPFKGQVLNQVALKSLNDTEDIVSNWVIHSPHPNVTIGRKCEPFKIEMVIRGFLAGHAARVYASGERMICGVRMPDGLIENDKLPNPIITPTTKAIEGHDEDISKDDIIRQGLVISRDYEKLESITQSLFKRGSEIASSRGLLLVDTKYEFGKIDDEIILMDEIHTPDSSRYYYSDGYEELQRQAKPQRQLSKEFVRKWLIENNFMGKENQTIPDMPDTFVNTITDRYIELYEKMMGEKFIRDEASIDLEVIERKINGALNSIYK
jgi:phosphoribosylaminoimidazole-succinocarboxamide synthase